MAYLPTNRSETFTWVVACCYVSSYVGFSCLFQGGIPLNRSFSVLNRSEPFRNLYMGCYMLLREFLREFLRRFFMPFSGGNTPEPFILRSEPFRGEVKTAKNHVRNHVRNQAKKNSPWKGLDRLGSLPVCHGPNQWPLTTCALP